MDNINVNRQNLTAMIAARGNTRVGAAENRTTAGRGAQSFADVLNRTAATPDEGALKITKHAELRMRDRNINLSEQQREKIALALDKAQSKGVREALVMLDGFALVANAASKTVITAVGEADLKRNIFTNIDGAVFA